MVQKVKEIMHNHTFVPDDMPISEVAEIMSKKKIGSVLVQTEKGLGILTERDITSKVVVGAKDPRKVVAKDIMTSPVRTTDSEAEIYEASKIFTDNAFRRLPVVDQEGKVLGIVTTRDIVRQFVPSLIKEVYHFDDFRF